MGPSNALEHGGPAGTPAAPLGRRERRKQETRRRLLAAAQELIAGQGAASLRISDVSERAGVGFGTFYTYFSSKEALVAAVVSSAVESAALRIGTSALETDDPAQATAASYRRFVRFAHDAPEVARVLVGLDGAETLFEQALGPYARRTLERGVQDGRFGIEDLELALTSIAAAALAAIRGVLDGRLGPGAETAGAALWLRAFGVPADEAEEIARRPLAPLSDSSSAAAETPSAR